MDAIEAFERLKDPRYFIERFFSIVNKDLVRVPFLFNPPQKKFYENHTTNDLVLKARKEGFSSLIEAIWLHACMFFKNSRVVTLSHEMQSTKRHFDRVRYYLQNMGTAGKPFLVELDEDNQKQIKFPETNSSYWIGTAGAKAFGRGDDISHLHLSEVAHYENQDVLTSALEACVPNAWVIMETTANGVGEAFHRLWQEAKDPNSGSAWKAHFFSWFDDPANVLALPQTINFRMSERERRMKDRYGLTNEQIYWYRTKESKMADRSKMPQEHPSNDQEAFLHSGRHCFTLQKLAEKRPLLKNPIQVGDVEDDGAKVSFKDSDEGRLRIWKMPRPGRSYLISADTGEGVPEGDYSVMQVFDRATWEQVAVWRARIDPGLFGREMVKVGYFFNNAVLIPELNNHGWATVEAIKTLHYPHLLNTRDLWKDGEAEKDGFPTNEKTRNYAITAARNAVDDGTIFINDIVTVSEMESFVQNEKTQKFEAQKGCHDDCVISFSIGAYCLKFLTVDETYGAHAKQRHPRYDSVTDLAGAGDRRELRRSGTGYR